MWVWHDCQAQNTWVWQSVPGGKKKSKLGEAFWRLYKISTILYDWNGYCWSSSYVMFVCISNGNSIDNNNGDEKSRKWCHG
jgi:hypothetical protein